MCSLFPSSIGAGTLPAFLARSANMHTIDVKDNQITALEGPYFSGAGMPTNSSLLNFRVSYNNITVGFLTCDKALKIASLT